MVGQSSLYLRPHGPAVEASCYRACVSDFKIYEAASVHLDVRSHIAVGLTYFSVLHTLVSGVVFCGPVPGLLQPSVLV
jgi:hypothetical protein